MIISKIHLYIFYLNLILNTELWQLYGVYLDEKVEDIDSKDGINNVLKKFSLSDLLLLPILKEEASDAFMQVEIPSTFDVLDLQIENQKKTSLLDTIGTFLEKMYEIGRGNFALTKTKLSITIINKLTNITFCLIST